MHPKTWAVAAALAFASTAVADQGRPRIYFPRNVKRQILNADATQAETTSSVASEPSLSLTSTESASNTAPPKADGESASNSTVPSTDSESASSTSQPTDDDDSLLEGLLPTADKSTTERRSDSSASESPSRGLPDIDDILTLSLPNIVEVTSPASATPATKTSAGLPDIFVSPTPSDSEDDEGSSADEETTPTTSDGIVVAPTGLLPGLLTGLPDLDLGLGGDKPSEALGSDSNGLPNPTAPAATSTSTSNDYGLKPTGTDAIPSVTDGKPDGTGLLDPILDPLKTLFPSPTDDLSIPSVTDSKPTGTGLLDPIIDPIQTLISSAVDDLSIPAPVNFSNPTGLLGTGPALTLLPTIPAVTAPNLPALTGLPIPDLGNGSDPNTNPIPTAPPLTDLLPIDPTNMTIPLPEPTAAPTGSAVLPPDNSTNPTTALPDDSYSTSSGNPTKTVLPGKNTTIAEPQPTKPPPAHVTTIQPIATVSREGWLGTQLIADETTETANSDAPAPTQSETLPAGMPNSIDASSDVVEQPPGTTLIRVVFDRRLHYEFVADNFTATQQIFMYFPMVIGHGENVEQDQVKMMRLSPIETKQKKGWITTAVFAYVPDGIIDRLQMDIHLTNSELYNPPHAIARGIASAIDPSYGIFPGSDLEVSEDDNKDGPGGSPFGDGSSGGEQSASQKGTTAGIAVGAVGAAVAYGAAMFLVARRYKRKKQSHRRSSSISGGGGGLSHSPTSDMRFTDSGSPATAMMGGALLSRDFSSAGYGGVAAGSAGSAGGRTSQGSGQSGAANSGRTAGYISAPVAAENSLGWN